MTTEIRIAQTKQEYGYCAAIRTLVFILEQKCDLDFEFDEFEDQCVSYLMLLDKKPIGTARYRMVDDGTAKVERIAVLKQYRGKQFGKDIVERVTHDIKSNRSVHKIIMSAQDYALSFYEKLGYKVTGEGYIEAHIPHHRIEMDLNEDG